MQSAGERQKSSKNFCKPNTLVLDHFGGKRKKKTNWNLDVETQGSDASRLPMSTALIITDVYIPQQMQGNLN